LKSEIEACSALELHHSKQMPNLKTENAELRWYDSMNIIIFENPHITRARVVAAPALPLTPSCPTQTLAIAQRLGQSARTHRVSDGIQA
jgi:hypothetical protein